MNLIVDASVAMKWFADEPGSDQARGFLDQGGLVAPTLILAEMANAFWKRIRRGVSTLEQALAALERLPTVLAALEPIEPLRADAMVLSAQADHAAYDCFYLALAQRERAPLL